MMSIKSKKAFTLFEVIIAVAIIAYITTGIYILFRQTVAIASTGQKELLAISLAREGIELTRNKRDTNWLESKLDHKSATAGDDWYDTLVSPPNPSFFVVGIDDNLVDADFTDTSQDFALSQSVYNSFLTNPASCAKCTLNRLRNGSFPHLFIRNRGEASGEDAMDRTFYRILTIEPLGEDIEERTNPEKLKVVSKVAFEIGSQKFNIVTIDTVLTNWK